LIFTPRKKQQGKAETDEKRKIPWSATAMPPAMMAMDGDAEE
jgi:hypothetical protein